MASSPDDSQRALPDTSDSDLGDSDLGDSKRTPRGDVSPHSLSKGSTEWTESAESPDSKPAMDSLESMAISGTPTARAPSLPGALPTPTVIRRIGPSSYQPGDRVEDFELLDELGRGGFGCVFLARQVSLGRLVALKITRDLGASEGRTLAHLQHENIVPVYSESVDSESGNRLLCMQYVAGPTLQKLMDELRKFEVESWSGELLLNVIDGLNLEQISFDPTALRDRELLVQADWIEAVCWICERLAEALAHAAERGVLHRDIKPSNILLSQYGRPLLADFNLAVQATDPSEVRSASFGGTLAYMSPEALDAFNPEHPAGPEIVDARSDIYSLGIVMFQLRHSYLPFPSPTLRGFPTADQLKEMSSDRRRATGHSEARFRRHALDGIIQRCLEADPVRRFPTALDLAQTLVGCRQLRHAERNLPEPSWFERPAFRFPLIWLVVLGLVPHLIGSGIQISYNSLQIVSRLDPEQEQAFMQLVIGYNLVMYPLCSLWMFCLVLPVFQAWRRWQSPRRSEQDEIDSFRGKAVLLPTQSAVVGCVGWFPGAMIFPIGMAILAGPLPFSVWGHFLISFVLAGLISVTYSFLGTQLTILRFIYPRMWKNFRNFRRDAADELRSIKPRVQGFQWLAGVIPLLGAALIVGVSPHWEHAADYDAFRMLITFLILMGMVGVHLAAQVDRQISQILALFLKH
jgi:eukaryotic-like serine/threonine-protein kinase